MRKSNTDSFIFLMNSDIDLIGEECREEKIIAPTPGRRKNWIFDDKIIKKNIKTILNR